MLIVKSIKEAFSVSSPNALSSFVFMLLSELDSVSPPLLSTLSSFTVSFLLFPHPLLVLSLESYVLMRATDVVGSSCIQSTGKPVLISPSYWKILNSLILL